MKIKIDTSTKISEVQEKFSKMYPYLKIDFYKNPHDESKLSEVSDLIASDVTFDSIRGVKESIEIDIDPEKTVAQVEQEFFDKCGVAMQVSRKSGDIWIQTSRTDYRTLRAQNDSGEAMSSMEGL